MNIILTGISGNLYEWILNFSNIYLKNHNIYIVSRSLSKNIPNTALINQDLSKPFKIDEHIDIAFYGAFVLPFNKCSFSEKDYLQININMLQNFLEAFIKYPQKIIFLSSNAINEKLFDSQKIMYAKAKYECEKLLIKYCIEKNIHCTILRLPPLVKHWSDFSYEIFKLKQKITIFPFSKNINVVFISQQKTFDEILNYAFFEKKYALEIINFTFNSTFNFEHKIEWLKSYFKDQTSKKIFFIPCKNPYKLNDYIVHKSIFENNWKINIINELNI